MRWSIVGIGDSNSIMLCPDVLLQLEMENPLP